MKTGNSSKKSSAKTIKSNKKNNKEIIIESVDQKGFVKRGRVIDQTVFDQMFMKELITLGQHESAHRFSEALSQSGTSIPSIDIERLADFTDVKSIKASAESAADRRMIFSKAYRFMLGRCGDESDAGLKLFMYYCHNLYSLLEDAPIEIQVKLISKPMNALSDFYGSSGSRDPRMIIRSQVYLRK